MYSIIAIKTKKAFMSANCYLIKNQDKFVLVDTGYKGNADYIITQMKKAGCTEEKLCLIIITHGDFDHIGNARAIRQRYNCPVAMSRYDENMAKESNMFHNRKNPNFIIRIILNVVFGLSGKETFSPDLHLEDLEDLSDYFIDADLIYLPGHSKGSFGLITKDGDFFCGDMFANIREPKIMFIIDDIEAYDTSLQKLGDLNIRRVFPGHGDIFMWKNHREKFAL